MRVLTSQVKKPREAAVAGGSGAGINGFSRGADPAAGPLHPRCPAASPQPLVCAGTQLGRGWWRQNRGVRLGVGVASASTRTQVGAPEHGWRADPGQGRLPAPRPSRGPNSRHGQCGSGQSAPWHPTGLQTSPNEWSPSPGRGGPRTQGAAFHSGSSRPAGREAPGWQEVDARPPCSVESWSVRFT